MEQKKRAVVITGMSAITSLGLNLTDTWEGLVSGKSGVGSITLFDASKCATRIAAEVPQGFEQFSKKLIPRRSASQMTRMGKFSLVCAKQAFEDSGLSIENLDRYKTAVIVGAANSGYSGSCEAGTNNYILKTMVSSFSAWISLEYGFKGPNFTVNTACASSAYAIGLGYNLIKSGRANVVIVGGTESMISSEGIAGFNELLALSENNGEFHRACRPFDKDRDGFVMGEGAGMLVLESLESASMRGARIYCELAGYTFTSEGYNILSPEKDGEGMSRCMRQALKNSRVSLDEIDYINAHGTSTVLNDLYETMAIKKVFGKKAYTIPISSSKSMIGHTLGASGAIEGIITVKSIHEGIITPTINYCNPDVDCDLDYVPNKARKCSINVAISNSFGFGGHNCTLVFRKFENV